VSFAGTNKLRLPAVAVAITAGLALADSSVVALALPPIRVDLNASINGLAAIIGVYVVVLGIGLYPAAALSRRIGAARTGALGFALLGIASIGCAAADSLNMLLLFRGLQAAGGAAGVLAAFDLLDPGDAEGKEERHLWIAAAVFGTAAGPGVGGLLTQAFDWRSIFIIQVPIGLVGAAACLGISIPQPTHHASPFKWRPLISIGLLAGGLAAVLFTLVLQLVAGWNVEPIVAALVVSVLPIAAIATSWQTKSAAGPRAALGCGMVATGILCLILVPGAGVLWTIPPQLIAGIGMGLAFPALNGGLIPERTTADAARLLTARHAGMFLAVVLVGYSVNHQLAAATKEGEKQAVAALLDANISPLAKLTKIGPPLLKALERAESPRGAIATSLDSRAASFSGSDRTAYMRFRDKADDTLVSAANKAFMPAYLIAGLMALVAALLLLDAQTLGAASRYRLPGIAAGAAVVAVYFAAHAAFAPKPVAIADPCKPRDIPAYGGIQGMVQKPVLKELDRRACENGSSREELVFALLNPAQSAAYEQKFGRSPGSLSSILSSLGGQLGSGLVNLLKSALGAN